MGKQHLSRDDRIFMRANLPEWCGVTITTMAQLMDCVAV